jgi:hypothetical protein
VYGNFESMRIRVGFPCSQVWLEFSNGLMIPETDTGFELEEPMHESLCGFGRYGSQFQYMVAC